jgi:hypothetical protein
VKFSEALYEQDVQQHYHRIDEHETAGHFFKGRITEGEAEDMSVKNKFNGCGDIEEPAILLMEHLADPGTEQFHEHDEKEKEREQAECRSLQVFIG